MAHDQTKEIEGKQRSTTKDRKTEGSGEGSKGKGKTQYSI